MQEDRFERYAPLCEKCSHESHALITSQGPAGRIHPSFVEGPHLPPPRVAKTRGKEKSIRRIHAIDKMYGKIYKIIDS